MSNIKTTDEYPVASDSETMNPSRGGRTLRFAAIAAILACGIGISGYFMSNKPRASRKSREPRAMLVDIMTAAAGTEQIFVQTLGNVTTSRSIDLAARVSGQILEISPEFIPGGYLEKGDRIVRIDPRDFELIVRERESSLARARSDLKVEMGQQEVSRREYDLLGKNLEGAARELLLREPQLAAIKAAVDAAEASLEQARLNLQRTAVRVPFNAVVQSRKVNLGSQVSMGMNLGSLIGTDEYWVQVSIPVKQLKWIDIPGSGVDEGSSVRIYNEAAWGQGIWRRGKVLRQLSELEPRGRLAQLLISVEDPLGLNSDTEHPLILGSYVRVSIEGSTVENVVKIPENALRNHDTIWLITPEKTLDIHSVEVVWQVNGSVYIRNDLPAESRVITSDISTPVNGMILREIGDVPDSSPGTGKNKGKGTGKSGGETNHNGSEGKQS